MNTGKKLKSKFEKIDFSSLSDEQVEAINKILDKSLQINKADISLAKSEERYRNIFENIQSVYFETSLDSTIIEISHSVENFTKRKRDELIGTKAIGLYFHNDERGKILQLLSNSKDGKIRDYYVELKDKDGAKLLCSLNAQLIKNTNGTPVKIVGSFIDLTQLNKTITDLKISEEKYRNIFENIQTIYYEATLDGTIIEISPSVEYYTKYKRKELIGTNAYDLYFNLEDKGKSLQQMSIEGNIRDFYIDLKDKDGTKIHCSLNAKLIKGENGVPEKYLGAIIDITQLNKTINALTLNEEKYRNIFENIQAVYYEAAIDGTILEISPSVEYYTKYKREGLLGIDIFGAYFEREDREKLIEQISKDEKLRDYCIELKDKDGAKLHCSLNAKLIRNKDGVPEKIIGAIIDITQLHETLNALKISEERYRGIYENANDIIWTSDLKGNFESVNPAGEKIFGIKFEEEINPCIQKYLTPESCEKALKNISAKIAKVKTTTTYEVEAIEKNGKRIFLELNTFLRYKNDKPVGIFGIGRDITERKKAEEELYKTREKYVELFENTSDIVYTMDFNGNFTSVNPKMTEKLLGYKFEEVASLNMAHYISPETAKVAFDNIAKKLRGEAASTLYEVDFVNKEGSYISLEINSMISYRDGKPFEIFGIARDITERRKTEEELNKTRERYKELFEGTNDIIYTMDFDGNFTSVNPMAEKMLGLKFEEVASLNMRDYLTPETAKIAFEGIAKKLRGEETHTVYEVDFINKDGSLISLEVNSMFRYKDGKPFEVFGIARNISERKKTEEELNKTRENYKLLSESTNDLLYTVDLEQKFSSMHPKCEKIIGYTVEEIVGKKVNDFITPESIKASNENLSKKLKGDASNTVYELDFINKNGSITSFEVNSMFMYKGGKPYEILGVARNITERNKALEALKKSEEKYKAIFENAPLGIMTADTNGTIIEINSMMLQLLGSQSLEESKKINLFNYPPLIEMGLTEIFKHCIEKGKSSVIETNYSSKWGRSFNAKAYIEPIKESEGTLTGFQVIVEDITEEKESEQQLKSALTEKEILLREIHHRVKNNMQIIISLINMQMQDIDDEIMTDKYKELQQRVRTMSIIHEDLYMSDDLSKINFGKYLNKLSNNLLNIYSHEHTVELKFNLADIFLGIDTAIPLGLIVNELLTNSFKHAFPGEWIKSHDDIMREIIIEFIPAGNKYRLLIGDNGIGLPDNVEDMKENTLGLMLVDILVSQLKGSMKTDSRNGTTYEIEIDKESK